MFLFAAPSGSPYLTAKQSKTNESKNYECAGQKKGLQLMEKHPRLRKGIGRVAAEKHTTGSESEKQKKSKSYPSIIHR